MIKLLFPVKYKKFTLWMMSVFILELNFVYLYEDRSISKVIFCGWPLGKILIIHPQNSILQTSLYKILNESKRFFTFVWNYFISVCYIQWSKTNFRLLKHFLFESLHHPFDLAFSGLFLFLNLKSGSGKRKFLQIKMLLSFK